MGKINKVLLMSGTDIPFVGAQTVIHQPRLWELGLIGGETKFLYGGQFLLFDKKSLIDQGESDLDDKSNFYIFMAIMNNSESSIHKEGAKGLLTLLFPDSTILFQEDKILLQNKNNNYTTSINEENFDEFQNIIRSMFFSDGEDEKDKTYDPADKIAEKIANKIKQGKNKKAKSKNLDEDEEKDYYMQYVSILSIGVQKDINLLMNYTVYQIKSEFRRFQAKYSFDINLKARLAGAQDLEEVKDWMTEIHP